MNSTHLIIITLISTFILSSLLIPLIIRYSKKHELYDTVNERKIHTGKIPRLGGIAIFLSFFAGFFVLLCFNCFSNVQQNLLFLIIPVIIIFLMGLIDDIHELPAKLKLAIQIAATIIVISGGYSISSIFSFPTTFTFGKLAPVVTFIWILGLTNAINLIDGIDGLCGSLTCLIAATFGLLFYETNFKVTILCCLLIASILGFLVYNFPLPKAKIFMGDSGSQTLGFILAIIPLIKASSNQIVPFFPIAITIIIPFFDTVSAIWRRLRDKKGFDTPDNFHIHHKLLLCGFSVRKVLLILILLQLNISFFVFCGNKIGGYLGFAINVTVFLMILSFFFLIHYIKQGITKNKITEKQPLAE